MCNIYFNRRNKAKNNFNIWIFFFKVHRQIQRYRMGGNK